MMNTRDCKSRTKEPTNRTCRKSLRAWLLLLVVSGSHIGGRCLGEDLEEDAPRYEPVVVDEKAEDEADPEHEDTEQKRVDNGAIGIVILEARYHHGSQDPGGRPGREDDAVDPRHALLTINVNHHGRHDREAAAEAAQHVTYKNSEDPRIVLRHQDAKHDQLRGEQEAKGVDTAKPFRHDAPDDAPEAVEQRADSDQRGAVTGQNRAL